MAFTKSSVTLFLIIMMTISFSNDRAWARPGIKQGEGETCIGSCEAQYGNRQCDEDCVAQQYSGGECALISGEATPPQCCCFK
ncbi:unnamed protein product [Eruca vesicaria subsp. sativa]|uniref:Defensin-like domain-containing protein n=1 Tax=Eruca vesicaria subsp. sativa TaxID=29727 RepID=A0ABC8L746_ERUVS|nr:unnamed protein product [Eruca vesicaria subsp. sativa]